MARLRWRNLRHILIVALGSVIFIYSLSMCRIFPPQPGNVVQKHNAANSSKHKLWNPEEALLEGHRRLPFPVEKTGPLPTAYSTVAACRATPSYLFFIHTAPGNFHQRTIMRSCLGNKTLAKHYRWATVFFVGLSANTSTAEQVNEEAFKHGDVVVLPYIDTFRNLTYKFVYGVKWAIENCPSVEYVVKLNDDFVVNILKVLGYLEDLRKPKQFQFHCMVTMNAFVIRNANSKWYLSEETYPNKLFPRYCGGGCTMLNARALQALYNASFFLPFHGIDDVYVTGEASLLAGVHLIEINRFYVLNGKDKAVATSRNVMFSQIRDHQQRASAWTRVSATLAKTLNRPWPPPRRRYYSGWW